MNPAARRVARTIAEGRHFHVELEAATLVRVTSHPRGEPYFGRTGRNRFDAQGPNLPLKRGYWWPARRGTHAAHPALRRRIECAPIVHK